MKIRINPPTAPPELPAASTSAGTARANGSAPVASTSAAPASTGPRIRIKQSNNAQQQSSASSTVDGASASAPRVKAEEDGATGATAAEQDEGNNSGLSLRPKRKRSSVTPSAGGTEGADVNGVAKIHQHQTRHGFTAEEIDKAYEDGMKLWQTLREHKKDSRALSSEFMHLPPRSTFPDYYQMIKKPISFTEVRTKLERREYGTNVSPTSPSGVLKLVSDDFKQMFFNAKRYNMKGSPIYNDARKLDRLHRHTYAKLAGLAPEPDEEDGKGGAAAAAKQGSDAEDEKKPSSTLVSQHRAPSAQPGQGQSGNAQTQQPPKKKVKKSHQAQQVEDKPITLTKWLSMKVDDLVAMTDKSGRVLSEIFMQVPPQHTYPDYYQIIQKPISFQLVRSRLKNRNYQSIEKFKDDVNLIFANAHVYNEEGSQVWQDAKDMKDYFTSIMQEEPPEFFVRPRNTSQQAVSTASPGLGDPRFGFGGGGSGYPGMGDLSAAGGASFAASAQNAKDTVKFGEFDEQDAAAGHEGEEDPSSEMQVDQPPPVQQSMRHAMPQPSQHQMQAQMQQPRLASGQAQMQTQAFQHPQMPTYPGQQTNGALQPSPSFSVPPYQQGYPGAVPQSSYSNAAYPGTSTMPLYNHLQPLAPPQNHRPSLSPAASTKNVPLPKTVSRLVGAGNPPSIASFDLQVWADSALQAEYSITNSVTRQHTLSCSRRAKTITISPRIGNTASVQDVSLRTRHQQNVEVAPTTDAERSAGAYQNKWIVRPSSGLNVYELSVGQDEVYRLFVTKLAT